MVNILKEIGNVQINKLKKAVKSNEEVSLRLGIKNFNKAELQHEFIINNKTKY